MNIKLNILFVSLAIIVGSLSIDKALPQTEGFNVKTPTQKMSDAATEFLGKIIKEAKNNPKNGIPQELICSAKCYLIIPSVKEVAIRADFEGTGLLSCHQMNVDGISVPLFYDLSELKSFYEGDGGVIVLVTDNDGVKSILSNQVELTSDNTTAGTKGMKTDSGSLKSFVSFAMVKGIPTEGYDLDGSVLIYANRDTFNAYQETMIPIDILLRTQDLPPAFDGFNSAIKEWTQSCK